MSFSRPLRVCTFWLVALCVTASASTLDAELSSGPAQAFLRSTKSKQPVRRLTAQELLQQESDKIQKNVDLVDQALMGVTGRGHDTSGGVLLGSGLPVERTPVVPGHLVQANQLASQSGGNQSKGQPYQPAPDQNTPEPLPDWYQPGKIVISNGSVNGTKVQITHWNNEEKNRDGMVDTLSEWSFDHGAYTMPRRNKVVLALIEAVPFLGVFGMDRLYLGQPVLATLKALSFFCTAGVVGGVWSLIDAYLIARNCVNERTQIDEFGLIALFQNTEMELKVAAGLGALTYFSWALHMCWFGYLLYCWLIRPPVQNFGDPTIPKGVLVDAKQHPFMTDIQKDIQKDDKGLGGAPLRQDEKADYQG